jgi:hypothetical protein
MGAMPSLPPLLTMAPVIVPPSIAKVNQCIFIGGD